MSLSKAERKIIDAMYRDLDEIVQRNGGMEDLEFFIRMAEGIAELQALKNGDSLRAALDLMEEQQK